MLKRLQNVSYNIIQVLKFGNVVCDLHVYVFVGAKIIILAMATAQCVKAVPFTLNNCISKVTG